MKTSQSKCGKTSAECTTSDSRVTVQEIVNKLRAAAREIAPHKRQSFLCEELANRIEGHGIAPTDVDANGCSTHPKARHGFARQASHSSDEYVCECAGFDPYEAGYQAGLSAAWDADGALLPEGMVLVRKEPVAWRHWHPIELCFEYHLRPVCDRCDALYIAAAPEVKP